MGRLSHPVQDFRLRLCAYHHQNIEIATQHRCCIDLVSVLGGTAEAMAIRPKSSKQMPAKIKGNLGKYCPDGKCLVRKYAEHRPYCVNFSHRNFFLE